MIFCFINNYKLQNTKCTILIFYIIAKRERKIMVKYKIQKNIIKLRSLSMINIATIINRNNLYSIKILITQTHYPTALSLPLLLLFIIFLKHLSTRIFSSAVSIFLTDDPFLNSF